MSKIYITMKDVYKVSYFFNNFYLKKYSIDFDVFLH